ncbi:hypothetical protein VUN82_02990 [Micrococcaceae bacterium Sec5.1]
MTGLPKYRDGGRDINNYRIEKNFRRKRRGLTFAVVFGVISILGLGPVDFLDFVGRLVVGV